MTSPAPTKELLDIHDVAAIVGLSPDTIRRSIDATEPRGQVRPFPGWKWLGRKRVITRAGLDAWINNLPDA